MLSTTWTKIPTFVILISTTAWAGEYKLDESHTQIGFKIKHLVISTVSGRFNKFSGGFQYDSQSGKLEDLKISIQAASIDTNEPERDKHLKSADFFDVEKFPNLTFESKKIISKENKPSKIEGELTIHGVKKPVILDVDYKGTAKDPWGNESVVFEATGALNRKDFGLKWNKSLDKGGVMIADDVKIVIEGEALLQKPKK